MKVFKIIKYIIAVILFCIVAGFVVMYLWNWLMPALFGLRTITFAQSLGLLVLSKLLLGGFHKHGGGHGYNERREWKRHMKARWEGMSPEDREKFRAGMRGRRGWRGCGPFDPRGFEQERETTEPTAQR